MVFLIIILSYPLTILNDFFLNNIGPDTPDLEYIQANIATAYYENMLK